MAYNSLQLSERATQHCPDLSRASRGSGSRGTGAWATLQMPSFLRAWRQKLPYAVVSVGAASACFTACDLPDGADITAAASLVAGAGDGFASFFFGRPTFTFGSCNNPASTRILCMVSEGCAPCCNQWETRSRLRLTVGGLVCGSYDPKNSTTRLCGLLVFSETMKRKVAC